MKVTGNSSSMLKELKKIPRPVVVFLVKIALVFLIWKVSYYLYLEPYRIIDKPLTKLTAQSTTYFLSLCGYPLKDFTLVDTSGSVVVLLNNIRVFSIADACNALELFVLYAGFLVCMPQKKWKWAYVFGGILIIFLLNILRCSLLFYMNLTHHKFTDIAHHYIFNLIIYAVTFVLWVKYTNAKQHNSHEKQE